MGRARSVATLVAVVILAGLGLGQAWFERAAAAQGSGKQAPRFEVDPFWPKPLPNHWVLGNAIGVWVDERDHVWIIHRGSATLANNEKGARAEVRATAARARRRCSHSTRAGRWCSRGAGPAAGYDWPDSNHGIFIDHLGNVWIGGNGPGDSHIMKFTQRRQVRRAVRQAERARERARTSRASRRSRAAAPTRRASAGSRRSSSSRRRMKRTSPTATSTAASPCSTPRRAR